MPHTQALIERVAYLLAVEGRDDPRIAPLVAEARVAPNEVRAQLAHADANAAQVPDNSGLGRLLLALELTIASQPPLHAVKVGGRTRIRGHAR